jgi:hypothetical protein
LTAGNRFDNLMPRKKMKISSTRPHEEILRPIRV